MNTIEIILLIIWLLLGIIAVWRTYYGVIKEWSVRFDTDYWKYMNANHESFPALQILLAFGWLMSLGGLMTLILFETGFKYNCWYYKHKETKL